MSKVKIIRFVADSDPFVMEIEPTLEQMQSLVGGLIDIVSIRPDGLMLCCNDEGKILDLPWTVTIWDGHDYIAGDCFLFRSDADGETISVTQADIDEFVGHGRIEDL